MGCFGYNIDMLTTPVNFDEVDLIAFDLDDTLAKSKMPIDSEMSELLCSLLTQKRVAVVSGASFDQFKKQFLSNLGCPISQLTNLFLISTNGACLYEFRNDWVKLSEENFSPEAKAEVMTCLTEAVNSLGFDSSVLYGQQIEDRGSQVTFSGLGSEAPIEEKKGWDSDRAKRTKLVELLQKKLQNFSIKIGGMTSVDITPLGIDKASGLQKLAKLLSLDLSKLIYVGDALFPGGNDESVMNLGISTIQVAGPEETKKIISDLINKK